MYEPKESDWKKYKKLVEGVEEKYLERRISFLINKLQDPLKSAEDRFWSAKKQIDKDLKALNQSLSEHKRNTIFPNMMNMLHNGMITKEDLEPFSDELKELLERVLDSFR